MMTNEHKSRKTYVRFIYGVLASCILFSTNSFGALIDRGNGLIYDNVLDVTWLQDANYMNTLDANNDGQVNHNSALAWVNNLSFQGYDDWRLPTLSAISGANYDFGFSFDGSTDRGYNSNTNFSELAHMFYHNLNNISYFDTMGDPMQPGSELFSSSFVDAETGLTKIFENIAGTYWNDIVDDPILNAAWAFNFDVNGGGATTIPTGEQQLLGTTANVGVWAVRDGDVSTTVIEPPVNNVPTTGSLSLMLLGFFGLICTKKVKWKNMLLSDTNVKK